MSDQSNGGSQKPDLTALPQKPVSLKQVAEYLGLNPATVSVVLNNVPGRSIPQATRDRIKAAAKELNYQPNLVARSLRKQRTLTIGILVPELGDGYHSEIMSGIGDHLMGAGYFYFTAHHRHKKSLIEDYTRILIGRGAQGILAVDTLLEEPLPVPVVAIAGHKHISGVTNVLLDHRRAAELTLTHLYSLGHREIAFMRGQPFSSDSDTRWNELLTTAQQMGIELKPELQVRLKRDMFSPELGYPVVQQLISTGKNFTALIAFNDISAIGAIRALQDMNLRVPQDVSVIGFDNIKASAFTMPRLTTIRQPLEEIGRIATQSLLNQIHNTMPPQDEITVEPQLIIRDSTGPATPTPWKIT